MHTLAATVIAGKNSLTDANPFLTLLQITLPGAGSASIFLAGNTQAITYGGQSHAAFPFIIDDEVEAGDGALPTRSVRVGNATLSLNAYLDANAGLVGGKIKVVEVYANTSPATLVKSLDYDILSTTADAAFVVFSLGLSDPLRRRYPRARALSNGCPWVFKGAECKYAGVATQCNRTLDNCQTLANSVNFGGRPGIAGAVRLV